MRKGRRKMFSDTTFPLLGLVDPGYLLSWFPHEKIGWWDEVTNTLV